LHIPGFRQDHLGGHQAAELLRPLLLTPRRHPHNTVCARSKHNIVLLYLRQKPSLRQGYNRNYHYSHSLQFQIPHLLRLRIETRSN
jgi:hypothetical protein